MLNFKQKKFFFQYKIIILHIFIILIITSCNLNIFQKNHNFFFDENDKNNFKKIITPNGIKLPDEDLEYKIPYTEEDLKKEKIDIFPPV
ncbi:hypothetical protein [Buchnera aphidicola]|nr:hypothetical protein [Buchnera aphidicola]